MRKKPIPKEYVFSLLSYNKEAGQFTWLVSRGTVKAGRIAGCPHTSRGKTYIHIRINKTAYKAHHLAWLFQHGEWPSFDLDHIDGDGTNNRISNLRKCSMSQNKGNSKKYKNNKSGHKGVCKHGDRWIAYISKNHKCIHLGVFSSLEEAVAAYWEAAQKLHGEFARAA